MPGSCAAVITAATEVAEIFPDGTKACHQDLPYRPDFKFTGSYPLPLDFLISGTFQFTRGVQNGGAAPASWRRGRRRRRPRRRSGRAYSAGATTKSVNLIAVGQNYGFDDLKQLDLRLSKRFKLDSFRFRVDLDAYNLFNSDWPFTLNNTFSTAATSNWLKPTNVLQARFFKIGAQFDF